MKPPIVHCSHVIPEIVDGLLCLHVVWQEVARVEIVVIEDEILFNSNAFKGPLCLLSIQFAVILIQQIK